MALVPDRSGASAIGAFRGRQRAGLSHANLRRFPAGIQAPGDPPLREGLDEPRRLPRAEDGVDLTSAPGARWWAGAVIGGTAVLYVIFW